MKAQTVLSFSVSLTFLMLGSLTTIQSTTAAPAPVFRPILNDIRNQLPRDMMIRLPAFVPDTRIKGVNTYAIVRGYQNEYQGGIFEVDFASSPDCSVTACNMGHIFVTRNNPLNENNGLSESRRSAKPINLQPGIRGFYFYARSGSAGYRHHVFWKQNDLFFEVESRALSKQQVIKMAISMASEPPIRQQTSNTSVQSQKNTTDSSNSNLVTAVRNAVGNNLSYSFDRIEYFSVEVDLNNDKNKEVIVYTAGPQCGVWECPVYIFKRSGDRLHLIGTTGAASNEAQIAVVKSRSNGWLEIATLVYDYQQRRTNWKLHKFNGSVYQNTYQNLSSKPTQIILRPNRGSGVTLDKSSNHRDEPARMTAFPT